jgi:glycogen(starch) synthase
MRILFLNNVFPPHVMGGYEIACSNVAAALHTRGHQIEVLVGHAPIATSEEPPYLHRALVLRAFDPVNPHTSELADAKTYEAASSQYANTATLLAHLRRFRPDLVYVWHLWGVGGLAMLDLLDQVGIPWVMHLMDCIPTYLLNGVVPVAAALFSRDNAAVFTRAHVITMSEQIITEIADTCGVRFDIPPSVIPGWVNADGLTQRARYSERGHLRLVSAGSLGVHKGTDVIVQACGRLIDEGYRTFHVDIYGFGWPEPWVAMAAQLGAAEHITFHNALTQPELLAVLPEYDAFLFPTQNREPFGFVPIEAAACGAVPIVTRNAGVAERLVDGVHALKIDRTPESLATAIRRLLTGDADVAAIGRRAARLVRSDLSFTRCLDDIEQVLQKAAVPWDPSRLDDPRLPAILFAKHALGQHLTAYR